MIRRFVVLLFFMSRTHYMSPIDSVICYTPNIVQNFESITEINSKNYSCLNKILPAYCNYISLVFRSRSHLGNDHLCYCFNLYLLLFRILMCIREGKRVFVTRQVVCYYQLLMLLCQHFRPGNVSNHKMEGCQNIDKRKSSPSHTKCHTGNLSSFEWYLKVS